MTDFRTYTMSRPEKILFLLGISAAALALAALLYHNLLFAAVLLPFVPRIQRLYVQYRMERRRNEYLLEFKDFLFLASTSIGAGRSMKDAIGESITDLQDIYGEKALLGRELRVVHTRMEVGNEEDVTVLMDLALQSGIEDVVDFVTIYQACKVTGASLILAMNRAAAMIIEKMTIEREIRELSHRKKTEGLMIFSMPVLVLLFLNLTAPDYIAPLYHSLTGRMIMTFVVAANIGIYEIIQKIVKVTI